MGSGHGGTLVVFGACLIKIYGRRLLIVEACGRDFRIGDAPTTSTGANSIDTRRSGMAEFSLTRSAEA